MGVPQKGQRIRGESLVPRSKAETDQVPWHRARLEASLLCLFLLWEGKRFELEVALKGKEGWGTLSRDFEMSYGEAREADKEEQPQEEARNKFVKAEG